MPKAYSEKDDVEVRFAVELFLRTSETEAEVRRRIKNEVGYYGPVMVVYDEFSISGIPFKATIYGPAFETVKV